jgi:hypothetical protein
LGFEEGKIEEICACVISSIVGTGSNMPYDYEINPNAGVGKLQFGMTRDEVVEILGKPDDVEIDSEEEVREFRNENGLQTAYSRKDKRLIEIGFSSNIKTLTLNNTALFTNEPLDVFRILLAADEQPYELLGFIVLLNLGITLTGFHDEATDERAVTVFTRGRWDSIKEKLKPFKMK